MKFSCEKALLTGAVAVASRAVAAKSSIPAMEGILIEAGDQLRLTGYNLETGIRATVPAEIRETGSLVLSARLFGEIVRKMPDDVVASLKGLGKLLRERLSKDFAKGRRATADKVRTPGDFAAGNVTDGDKDTYWTTADGETSGAVTIDLGRRRGIHYVMLQEYIRLGQRVRAFDIETSIDGSTWQPFAEGTTIGYKRIMAKDDNTGSYGAATEARYVRVNIRDSHTCPLLHTISIY